MTDKNPIAKTEQYIERHELDKLISIDAKGVVKIDDNIYEKTVLADTGLTLDQVKKLRKHEGELYPAVVHHTAGLAATAFKGDANLSEVGFNFNMGGHKAAGVFSREGNQRFVGEINHEHKNAEFKRVVAGIEGLFADINS